MELLVTLDENYLAPLETMLCSLSVNDPGTPVRLWLIHGGMPEEALVRIRRFCQGLGWDFRPCKAPEELFAQAPVPRYYSTAMYYRLLASRILPDTLDRVIYLDPDTLILTPISPRERLDLEGNLFAAAAHTAFSQLTDPVNRVRLHSDSPINGYFNSGVLVMDLAAQRRELDPEDIFRYAADHAAELIRAFAVKRVMFGTDYPMWTPEEEVERFEALPLTAAEKEQIYHVTAEELLD